jgi:hypothetical protein
MPEEIPERRLERLPVESWGRIGLAGAINRVLCSRSRYRPEYFHPILVLQHACAIPTGQIPQTKAQPAPPRI